MERVTPVVLAVGTSHPLNIAGVGLDARIAPLLGVRIVTIIAGVSAQSGSAVLARTPVDARTIDAQFAALRVVPVRAVHVGALLDASSVTAVAEGIATLGSVKVVCDPVISASTGERLVDDESIVALRDELFASCTLITPNVAEAGQLVGRQLDALPALEEAARELQPATGGAVLVKGGHLSGDPIDVLATADGVTHFRANRIAATLRGTGDLLACAIAARLAYGDDLIASINAARAFVRGCLAAGVPFAGVRTVP